MNEWVSEWMNEWVNEWVSEWGMNDEWMNEWMSEWMSEWGMNEWGMNEEWGISEWMKSLFILTSHKIKNYKNEKWKSYKADEVRLKILHKIRHCVKSIS